MDTSYYTSGQPGMSEGHRALSFLDQCHYIGVTAHLEAAGRLCFHPPRSMIWIWDGIDKIIDCQSRVDPGRSPSTQINKMWIWGGLTKLLINDLGWICVYCLPPPNSRINKMRIWGGLTKLLIVDPLCRSLITFPPGTLHFLRLFNFKYIDVQPLVKTHEIFSQYDLYF